MLKSPFMFLKPFVYCLFFFLTLSACSTAQSDPEKSVSKNGPAEEPVKPVLDSNDYASRMKAMANGDSSGKWKFSGQYPKVG
ncbi:MAG: hypothetical protein RLZZ204_1332, partial [Bacteroidota bacterium]